MIIISGTLFIAYLNNTSSSFSDEEERNFGIENIQEIDKIFLTKENGEQVTLHRKSDHWLVNDIYVAQEERINTILETAKRVKVRRRVAKTKQDQVLKNLATSHVKVEFYADGDLIRSYFIGGATQNSEGTYMLMTDPEENSNAEHPFITYIPGFQGYLTPRYDTKMENWRDLKLFHFPNNRIKSIELTYTGNPTSSFNISIQDKKYVVKQGDLVLSEDLQKIRKYLLGFKSISAERLVSKIGYGKTVIEKLKHEKPFFILKVTDLNDQVSEVIGYKRRANMGELNAVGEQLEFDADKFYGFCFQKKELAILQYFVFDPLLWKASDFL